MATPIGWEPSVIEQPTVFATSPQPTPQQEIQPATPRAIAFEKIFDPWTLEPQSPDHSVPKPAVIIPLPRLRLLPPAFLCKRPNLSGLKQNRPRLRNPTSTSTKRQSTKPRKITGKYHKITGKYQECYSFATLSCWVFHRDHQLAKAGIHSGFRQSPSYSSGCD
ncbi:hypothetical protein H6G91_32210 [Nostoc muscorum FACHB-395]|nr:hypothetical protein [Desmonostoc muscorum FACHB-395]